MHSMIVGMTESGKTTLAKKIVQKLKNQGIKSIVLDRMRDNFNADYSTTDKQKFLDTVFKSYNCAVFVDESGQEFDKRNSAMNKLATMSRHWGHSAFFLGQRYTDIPKTVRDQCGRIFIFCISFDDSKILANEFNSEELRNAYKLQQGEYYHKTRFGKLNKNKVF